MLKFSISIYIRSILLIAFFSALFYSHSYAWGPKGHALVGEVAAAYLKADTRKNVEHYLAGMPFDTAANWMDAIRSNYKYDFMKPWHYVNFESNETYKPTAEDNAFNRINYCINELKHKELLCDDQIRFDILVLMHLIGDIHQPLHVGYGSDKGGNTVPIVYNDTLKTNLHRVWDESLVDQPSVTLENILAIGKSLSPSEMATVEDLKVQDWMNESRALLDTAYAIKSNRLGATYAKPRTVIVEKRLLYAGMRLAAVLEKLFASESTIVPQPLENSITAAEAKNYYGKEVLVCTKVYGVKKLDNVTFITVGARYPNSPLTLVVFAKDRDKFNGDLEDIYNNKYICIKGDVKEYKEKAEIIIDRPDEIIVQ